MSEAEGSAFPGWHSVSAGAPLIVHATWHAYRALIVPAVNNTLAQV